MALHRESHHNFQCFAQSVRMTIDESMFVNKVIAVWGCAVFQQLARRSPAERLGLATVRPCNGSRQSAESSQKCHAAKKVHESMQNECPFSSIFDFPKTWFPQESKHYRSEEVLLHATCFSTKPSLRAVLYSTEMC